MRKASVISFPAILVLARLALAQPADIPLRNWTVPPYASSSSGLHTMVDATPPRAFIGLPVCRLLDTRPPVNNPLDGDGIYAADAVRTYDLEASCGIPVGADAVSLNVTVTNTGNHPFGHVKIWPANQAEPNVSTLNWSTGGVTESNAAIVALSPTGAISVKTGNAGADVIIDTNGYFSDVLGSPANVFQVVSNVSSNGAVRGTNLHLDGYGVWGENPGAGIGVYGSSASYFAVRGDSATWDAVAAFGGRDGGYFQGVRYGINGISTTTSGVHYGVVGDIGTNANNSAGVLGTGAAAVPGSSSHIPAGVRGESTQVGVLGISSNIGVAGVFRNSTGVVAEGSLGNVLGYGVYAATGGMGGTGPKYFVDPHPNDASKVIRYIALEGNEPGTYFRGRGRFDRGMARIAVPEDFRLVTDAEGLSVQVTPIGAMATVAVLKADLNEIVVQSSRNVEFYYTVNGVRRTFKHLTNPVGDGQEYMPRSAEERMPAYPDEQKRLLIQNGTYNADGTVNMETARRLGWDGIWARRAHPEPRADSHPSP